VGLGLFDFVGTVTNSFMNEFIIHNCDTAHGLIYLSVIYSVVSTTDLYINTGIDCFDTEHGRVRRFFVYLRITRGIFRFFGF